MFCKSQFLHLFLNKVLLGKLTNTQYIPHSAFSSCGARAQKLLHHLPKSIYFSRHTQMAAHTITHPDTFKNLDIRPTDTDTWTWMHGPLSQEHRQTQTKQETYPTLRKIHAHTHTHRYGSSDPIFRFISHNQPAAAEASLAWQQLYDDRWWWVTMEVFMCVCACVCLPCLFHAFKSLE